MNMYIVCCSNNFSSEVKCVGIKCDYLVLFNIINVELRCNGTKLDLSLKTSITLARPTIYVTGKACNQAFHGMPGNFSQFLK